MAAAAILNFGKISITPSGYRYMHQIIWGDAPRPYGDDHMTKSRNRKLIRVTSSTECLRHMCVDLSDYRVYLSQILYRAQAPQYWHEGMFQIYMTWKFNMVAAAILDFENMIGCDHTSCVPVGPLAGELWHFKYCPTWWPSAILNFKNFNIWSRDCRCGPDLLL